MGHTALCAFCTIPSTECEAASVCGGGPIIKETQAKIGLSPSRGFVVLVHSEV